MFGRHQKMGSAANCDGNDNEKMDIMATSEGVHIAATMALKIFVKNDVAITV